MRNKNMNKNLILICICVFLLSQSAWADCQITGNGLDKKVISSCEKNEVKTDCNKTDYPKEAVKYKNYIKQLQQDRATVYNALNLTDEQIKVREELIEEYSPYYEQKLDELLKESFRLKSLECANAGKLEINRCKKKIKNIKKDIEKCIKQENEKFIKCLTSLQRSKYNLIKELEERDYKEDAHRKDYYKSNPQMVPFGNPVRCPKPIGREG